MSSVFLVALCLNADKYVLASSDMFRFNVIVFLVKKELLYSNKEEVKKEVKNILNKI